MCMAGTMTVTMKTLVAVIVGTTVSVGVVGAAARQTPSKPAPAKPVATHAAAATAPAYKAIATVQDLMLATVDPASKVVFTAVSSEDTPNGTVEKAPKNDAEWFIVRQNALMLSEAANLLLIPGRRFAPPQNMQKHKEGELSPAEIEVRVSKDRAAWNKLAASFRDAASGAVRAAEAKRKEDWLAVGEALDNACENCHLRYWYPDQENLFKKK